MNNQSQNINILILIISLLLTISAQAANESQLSDEIASDSNQEIPSFGGNTSPQGQLYEEKQVEPYVRAPQLDDWFSPWREYKTSLYQEHAFSITGHYSTIYQSYSDVDEGDDDYGFSGDFRIAANWVVRGAGTGNYSAISMIVNNRHAFSDTAAGAFGGFGYYGIAAAHFGDFDGKFKVLTLTWNQSLNDGNSGFIVGSFDPNDYMNILGYANPQTTFSNLNILLEPSVAFPDVSWGIGGGHWFDNSAYIAAGINDANGFAGDDLAFFDGGAEFFKWIHLGWTPSKDQRYYKNIHLMAWHTDERENYVGGAGQVGQEAVYGVAIGANWTFRESYMPFFRLGFSQGNHDFYNRSATAGMLYKFKASGDLLGLAVNWGKFDEQAIRSRDSQTTAELFYRFQVSNNLAITPSVQYLVNPAYSSSVDSMWVTGVRARISF
ncbi:carbohydrate porin [Photobacterium sp. SDRW27]|uniref:carbohydrate porin n=1 Tax=Photobacterium obscurum TaxID=2829490 RepID=UPI00224354D1|nr:carbohydrate porin [Photobacterium obscurum]MCW8331412.1 carbohydrate porin [Photobacterium obscurum]